MSRGPVLPGTWGADAALKPYPYDPARAKKLLADAGFPNGFSTSLWVPESGSGMQSPVAMATVIQSNLKAVGVNVAHADHGVGRLSRQAAHQGAGAVRALLDGGQRGPDMVDVPPAALDPVDAGGPNRALYKNERYDELLHQARLGTDQAKRAEAYREAQRILYDDAPWIFVDHEVQTAALSRRVRASELRPSFDLRVETISLK